MKLSISKLAFALPLAILAFNVHAATDNLMGCTPEVIQTGKVESIIMEGTGSKGKLALNEMKSMQIIQRKDRLGRVMFTEATTIVKSFDGSTTELNKDGIYPASNIERYCSGSDIKDTKCVDICNRWTNFDRN
jgi:hypothetical protein